MVCNAQIDLKNYYFLYAFANSKTLIESLILAKKKDIHLTNNAVIFYSKKKKKKKKMDIIP